MNRTKITRQINDAGLELIKEFEGCVLHPYRDAVGLPTIGVGHLIERGESFPARITQAEADALLQSDLAKFRGGVEGAVKVPVNDNQFAALVALAFNIGLDAFERSSLLRRLNGGDYAGAAREFAKWNKAGGKTLAGLARRRSAEAKLFGTPVSVAQSKALPSGPVVPPAAPQHDDAGAQVKAPINTLLPQPQPAQPDLLDRCPSVGASAVKEKAVAVLAHSKFRFLRVAGYFYEAFQNRQFWKLALLALALVLAAEVLFHYRTRIGRAASRLFGKVDFNG